MLEKDRTAIAPIPSLIEIDLSWLSPDMLRIFKNLRLTQFNCEINPETAMPLSNSEIEWLMTIIFAADALLFFSLAPLIMRNDLELLILTNGFRFNVTREQYQILTKILGVHQIFDGVATKKKQQSVRSIVEETIRQFPLSSPETSNGNSIE